MPRPRGVTQSDESTKSVEPRRQPCQFEFRLGRANARQHARIASPVAHRKSGFQLKINEKTRQLLEVRRDAAAAEARAAEDRLVAERLAEALARSYESKSPLSGLAERHPGPFAALGRLAQPKSE